MMGYEVYISSKPTWATSDEVKDTIHNYASNENIDFFTIIGDHDDVPSELSNTGSYSHVTDLFYACLDGSGDWVPDIGHGRISVSSLGEANNVVLKIVNYERNPVTDASFYNTGLSAAYFQHAGSGYAERRFAQTSWEIRGYLIGEQGYNVNREFVTGTSTNPLYWNNGYYSSGEAIPDSLKKPTFAWDGDAAGISSSINNGNFFVFHRDHGGETLWGDPYYAVSNITALTNGNKLPVVFSINCLTGKFDYSSPCFSEVFLRHPTGGAVGVFCASQISYSGQNDGLAEGFIDAIWPDPGLVPLFPHNPSPGVTPHDPIYEMGLVLIQGKLRMSETWNGGTPPFGYEQYTYELFHYLGDASMKIWTAVPQTITATHASAIMIAQTSFSISNVSCQSGMATIWFNGQIIGCEEIIAGAATLSLNPVPTSVGTAILTITSHNYRPYQVPIQVIPGGAAIIPITPTAGDLYDVGEQVQITWQTFQPQEVPNVHIEFSSNGGNNYSDIIGSTPNNNSHTWNAASVESDQCVIRISDAADGDPFGVTEEFSIHNLSSISGTVTGNNPVGVYYSGPMSGNVTSAPNGDYLIERLIPGQYDLYALDGEFSSDTPSVTVPPDANLDLTIRYPNILVDPLSFHKTLDPENSVKDTLTITNTGDANLTFDITSTIVEADIIRVSGNDAAINQAIIGIATPLPMDALPERRVSLQTTIQEENLIDKGKPSVKGYVKDTHEFFGAGDGEQVFGSIQNPFTSGPRTRGNLFTCTTSTVLNEHRLYLNVSTATQIWFVVYEGDAQVGIYNPSGRREVLPDCGFI